jgi:hypothetical protein
MNTYPVLQSGFVGLTQKGLKRPDPIEPSFREAIISKEFKAPLNKYFYSPEITEIFFSYCANSNVLKSFEFRERLIKATFEVFMNFDFKRFLNLQNEKPTISDLHKVFIMETLEYVMANKPRTIEAVQWIRMIEAGQVDHRVQVNVDSYFNRETLGTDSSLKIPNQTASLIHAWVSKERGFEDLLITLFVMFGERSRRTELTKDTF